MHANNDKQRANNGKKQARLRDTRARSMMSIRRPGVATRKSQPRSSSRSCGGRGGATGMHQHKNNAREGRRRGWGASQASAQCKEAAEGGRLQFARLRERGSRRSGKQKHSRLSAPQTLAAHTNMRSCGCRRRLGQTSQRQINCSVSCLLCLRPAEPNQCTPAAAAGHRRTPPRGAHPSGK